MARRTFSLCQILTAALLAAALSLIALPAREARADMVSKGGGFCRYIADSGRKALENKDYRKAIASFNKGIEWVLANCKDKGWAFSGLDDLYSFRAEAYAGLGDFKRAAHEIGAILKEDRTAFLLSDAEWILPALGAAIKRQPKDAELRRIRARAYDGWRKRYASYFKGRARERTANYDAQLADRTALVKLARTKAERAVALVERSHLYLSLSNDKVPQRDYQPQLVLQDLSKAIGLDPRLEYYQQRASFYRYAKPPQIALAIEDMSKAIALDPKDANSYSSRASLYEQSGQTEAAIDDLTHALATVSPQDKVYVGYLGRRAEQLRKAGRLDAASSDYAQLIKREQKNARWRSERMLVLLEQGQDDQAEAERKGIARLERKVAANKEVLKSRAFLCEATDIFNRRRAKAGNAASAADMRRAWNVGEIVALVPLRHFVQKQNAKTEKAWAAVSQLVRDAQKGAGKEATGLDAIPEFKGPKVEQLKQALAFTFNQFETVKSVLAHRYGDQASALFAVSTAGHMAHGLNQLGVSSLNPRLGGLIAKHGPQSGAACDVWVETMRKAFSSAKTKEKSREEVVAAWTEAKKAFKEANARRPPQAK